ncbi:MAG: sensor histidine kinase [Pseudobdellovibrionaceae bacterium]
MKIKFFVRIFSVFTAAMIFILGSFIWYSSHLRQENIDEQIERTASSLVAAGLSKVSLDNFTQIQDLVLESLDDDHPNELIFVYDKKDRLIFENEFARTMGPIGTLNPGWQSVEQDSHRFRFLTLKLESGITLHMGLMLDSYYMAWRKTNLRVALLAFGLLIFIGVISFILTEQLLSPLKILAEWLEHLVLNPRSSTHPLIFQNRLQYPSDEITQLIQAVKKLGVGIEESRQLQMKLVAHLAHEIKTPLTLIKNHLAEGKVNEAKEDIQHLNELLRIQIEWIQLNSDSKMTLEKHAIRSQQVLKDFILIPFKNIEQRLQISPVNDFRIYCHSILLKQIVFNLIENATKHSVPRSSIHIDINADFLKFKNLAAHPVDIKNDELGLEFKKGNLNTTGFGLGLAWIKSMCQRLNWPLQIKYDSANQDFTVQIDWSESTEGL